MKELFGEDDNPMSMNDLCKDDKHMSMEDLYSLFSNLQREVFKLQSEVSELRNKVNATKKRTHNQKIKKNNQKSKTIQDINFEKSNIDFEKKIIKNIICNESINDCVSSIIIDLTFEQLRMIIQNLNSMKNGEICNFNNYIIINKVAIRNGNQWIIQ